MSDPAQQSRVGTQFGHYHLRRMLGRGGMGEVYEAYDATKDRTVALKLLPEAFAEDPVYRERFRRESHSAARLQEPHVIPIHDYGEIDGVLYLDMRLVQGTNLGDMLTRYGPLAPPRAVAVISQVASALDAAHEDGLVHRDVKPENILVTRDDFVYLVDFGIANAATDEKLTTLGTAVGTYAYMAPERFEAGDVTYRADIYSLACVLHECLTGSRPYPADSVRVVITAHLLEPAPRPSVVRPGVPVAFDSIVARGMAKKPEDRYPSAGDLAHAAHDALTATDQDQAATILERGQAATILEESRQPATVPANPGQRMPELPPTTPHASSNTPRPQPSPSDGRDGTRNPVYVAGGPGGGPPGWGPQPPGPGGGPPVHPDGPPPRPKRSPWIPIAIAIAALVVAVLGGLGIWRLIHPEPVPPPAPIGGDSVVPASSPIPEPAPTVPATFTAVEQNLLKILPGGFNATNCTSDRKDEDAITPAVLTCGPDLSPGGPASATFYAYAEASRLNSDFTAYLQKNPANACPNGTMPGRYTTGGKDAGSMACYKDSDGNAAMVYTYEPQPAAAVVHGSPTVTAAQMFDWWKQQGGFG